MNSPSKTRRLLRLAALAAAIGIGGAMLGIAPAQARVFVGIGFGFPGYYYPPPYYYYPPPPPYYYAPPAYYAPPPAYYPQAPAYMPATPAAAPQISYTNRPAFYNSSGQQCREYRSTQMVGGQSRDTYGTACRDSTGQWRVAN
ncbi:MAG: hypothetical protein JO038_06240 [Alphaproteobacteria bacterium]|nr:hypothetical protein [Alphaproteobacteria bacterium]